MANTTGVPAANLPPPSVDGMSEGDILDPADIPPDGARVRIKRDAADTEWQQVFVFVGPAYENNLPVGSAIRDVVFYVDAQHFIADAEDSVIVRYEVLMRDNSTVPSDDLVLKMSAGFEGPATLDLSQENYVVVAERAPLTVPTYARMTRVATWGSPPYRYASSDDYVASVSLQTGEVTARGNGHCTITAIDSLNQPQGYPLTVRGIRQVHFLSDNTDWQGMSAVCDVANLDRVTRSNLARLRELYAHPDVDGVGDFLGWLRYPFWTGELVGSGTYWIYDVNTGSATSADANARHQALGISKRTP